MVVESLVITPPKRMVVVPRGKYCTGFGLLKVGVCVCPNNKRSRRLLLYSMVVLCVNDSGGRWSGMSERN